MNGNAVSQHSVKMGLVMLEVYHQSVSNGWERGKEEKKQIKK